MKLLTKTMVLSVALMTYMAEAGRTTINCSSNDDKFNRCDSNEPISSARLKQQFSNADCIQGQSWGYDRDSIWVDNGCRGSFEIQTQSAPAQAVLELDCSSINDNDSRCYVNGTITDAQLLEQYSNADCKFGKTFAWDDDYLLVTNGCRGRFRIRYRPYN